MLWRRPLRRVDRDASWQWARETYAALTAERDQLKRELAEVRRERDEILAAMRELQAAVHARWQAEAELAALYREREIARARAVERDQNAMLN